MLATFATIIPLSRRPAILLGAGAAAALMTVALCCPSPVPSTTAQAGADAAAGLWSAEARSAASGAKGYPLDEPPSGPDMTLAEATGMPMADGVSSDPLEVLLGVIAQQQRNDPSLRVVSSDGQTGKVVYD